MDFSTLTDEELEALCEPPQGSPDGEPHEGAKPDAEGMAVYRAALAERAKRSTRPDAPWAN